MRSPVHSTEVAPKELLQLFACGCEFGATVFSVDPGFVDSHRGVIGHQKMRGPEARSPGWGSVWPPQKKLNEVSVDAIFWHMRPYLKMNKKISSRKLGVCAGHAPPCIHAFWVKGVICSCWSASISCTSYCK